MVYQPTNAYIIVQKYNYQIFIQENQKLIIKNKIFKLKL